MARFLWEEWEEGDNFRLLESLINFFFFKYPPEKELGQEESWDWSTRGPLRLPLPTHSSTPPSPPRGYGTHRPYGCPKTAPTDNEEKQVDLQKPAGNALSRGTDPH